MAFHQFNRIMYRHEFRVLFRGLNREFRAYFRNHMAFMRTGFRVTPSLVVDEAHPKVPYYHASFWWLCWAVDLYWMRFR